MSIIQKIFSKKNELSIRKCIKILGHKCVASTQFLNIQIISCRSSELPSIHPKYDDISEEI